MKQAIRTLALPLCAAALPIALGSCAGGDGLAHKVRQFSITDLTPSKVDVVEVREKDLKPLPTGEERALAYQRSNRRFAGWFGPSNFVEPDLPSDGAAMEGSLLPSLD